MARCLAAPPVKHLIDTPPFVSSQPILYYSKSFTSFQEITVILLDCLPSIKNICHFDNYRLLYTNKQEQRKVRFANDRTHPIDNNSLRFTCDSCFYRT